MISSNAALAILQKLNKTVSTVFVQVPLEADSSAVCRAPDGNITGFQNFELAMGGKWLGPPKEAAPAVVRAAVIVHPDTAAHFEFLRAAETPSLVATAYEVIE